MSESVDHKMLISKKAVLVTHDPNRPVVDVAESLGSFEKHVIDGVESFLYKVRLPRNEALTTEQRELK